MKTETTSGSLLRIDETRSLERIADHLRIHCRENRADAILLGLSGGIDSCLLAAAAVHAMGRRSVHAAYLYDRQSGSDLRRNARRVADWLGIALEEKSIEPELRKRGLYASSAMRITSFSGPFNRLLHEVYRCVHGESPFVAALRRGGVEASDGDVRNTDFQRTVDSIEAGFNSRHVYRRRFLETQAEKTKCLLLGAANRTEWLTGWFVKGGVDDLPNQPLMGLYKTQIRQLAAFLGIPGSVLYVKPSPDMMRGITDEFALGANYSHIDLVLDFLEGGVTGEEILKEGVTEKEIHLVEKMKRLSAWKRNSPHIPLPVDGGPLGGLRLLGGA